MKKPIQITIDPNGKISFIKNDELDSIRKLGRATDRRASHVEPVSVVMRIVFRFIRSLVKDDSRTAKWTRSLPCLWRVNLSLSNGPTFGRFSDRTEAIDAEIDWLNENIL